MEKEAAPRERQRCRTTALSIISSLCSVASVAFCVHLGVYTADIKSRVVDLEGANGGRTFAGAPLYSADDFNSLVEQRVDELLSQRSYENFVKIRTARQASPDCNCPPGLEQQQRATVETAERRIIGRNLQRNHAEDGRSSASAGSDEKRRNQLVR